ncbi:MAG: SPOR domain-containing protein [Campylobacteraceae bacterium]|jgi:DedD protein|nr:SPOR domain-containing protein [Campylobacteraceae bacterium]
MEEKNELSDILLEQKSSNKIMQIKRLVVITVLLVLIFMLVILIMKLISKPKSDEIVAYPMSTDTPINNNEIVVANISIIEEDFDDMQSNESNETSIIAVIETNVEEPVIQTPPVKVTLPPKTQTTSTATKSPQSNTASAIKSGHYIQVGSFSNPPSKSFLNNIAKKDYEYHLHKTTVKSQQLTMVLIGPYPSENSARNALLDVKATIAKDAFYKKMP